MTGPAWRALVWVAAAVLSVGSFAAGAFALFVAVAGDRLADIQREAWRAVVVTILREALLPHLLLTAAIWLAVLRGAPRLDRTWRTLVPGVALAGVLAFVPIGLWTFDAWTPTGVMDVVDTALLLAGGVTVALLLPRRLVRGLAPGALVRPSR